MADRSKTQLQKLATKFPDKLITKNHAGREAASHTAVTQMLLLVVGPYSFSVKEVLYGGSKKGDNTMVTGCIGVLKCTIDGVPVEIEEAGGLENAQNQDGNGERLKHCTSDALKRCAMRVGLGLHIWAQDEYFLDKLLEKRAATADDIPDDVRAADDSQDGGGSQVLEGEPEAATDDEGPGTGDASKEVRLRLVNTIVKSGRTVERFENRFGRVVDLDQADALDWIEKLEADMEKKSKEGN